MFKTDTNQHGTTMIASPENIFMAVITVLLTAVTSIAIMQLSQSRKIAIAALAKADEAHTVALKEANGVRLNYIDRFAEMKTTMMQGFGEVKALISSGQKEVAEKYVPIADYQRHHDELIQQIRDNRNKP